MFPMRVDFSISIFQICLKISINVRNYITTILPEKSLLFLRPGDASAYLENNINFLKILLFVKRFSKI
jgi:hypothetical protein